MEQREERRLEAARLFRRGKLSQADIARRMGVSPGAVSQWYAAWQSGGDEDLRARPRTGRKARLSARQWEKLGHVLERGPMAAGFDAPRWTLRRIAALMKDRFGVTYHPRYLERPLRARGFALREQKRWAGGSHAGEGRSGERRTAAGRAGGAGRAAGVAGRMTAGTIRATGGARRAPGASRRAMRARPHGAASSRRAGGGRPSPASAGSRAGASRMRVPPSLLRSQGRQSPPRRSMH